MADIKTRNVIKGTIRTIDKASIAGQRMKTSYAKTKQHATESYSSDDNPVEYASGRISDTASRVLNKGTDGAVSAGHQSAKAAQAAAVKLQRNAGERKLKEARFKGNYKDVTLRENGKAALARSRARAKARQEAEKKTAAKAGEKTAKATKNVLKKLVISFAKAARAAGEAIKASAMAIAAAGSTAVIIIIVCVLFCTVFCVFEDSNGAIQVYSEEELASFEEGVGIGSTDIVKVAGTQIGNWNGRKFWSWYGFGSRQPWCACFVSWCANQCGYIKAGVIPKFALVTDGISWFKKKGEWRSRKYKPRPGDIIFFDWYGDGSRDHVGIVESCDGRYVHTIEGNSSNLCRRKTYPVGWYEIYGYGVPKYPGPKDKKSEKKTEGEKTDKK